jgi:hypothetical protein
MVAIACTLAALSFVRGPLFQRAMTLDQSAAINTQSNLDLKIAPYPILQYFQSNSPDPREKGGVTEVFSSVLKDLGAGKGLPYNQAVNKCSEYCTGNIKVEDIYHQTRTTAHTFVGILLQDRMRFHHQTL